MKRVPLIVTVLCAIVVAFIGCHKDPIDFGNVGVLNLSLQRNYMTVNKGALESFDARVTIYYSENDTISFNCRFVDTDGDGLYTNEPSDCIYVRRDVGFWVGVQAVIQGDTVYGMSDPTNLLYLSEENPLLDVTIVLESGYPRIVVSNSTEVVGEDILIYGNVLEGGELLEEYAFAIRRGQLGDEEKRIWAKRYLTESDMQELFLYADYEFYDAEIFDNETNRFGCALEMMDFDSVEYSVAAIALMRMNDGDSIQKVIHSPVVSMTISGGGAIIEEAVYIDEPYYNDNSVTLYGYYAGSSQVNECGFVLGFSEYELTDSMPCSQTDAIFSLTLSNFQPNTTYYYRAYVKTADGLIESEEIGQFTVPTSEQEPSYSQPTGYKDGYGYVDLGLPSGTLWAYTNIGANSPTDYGNYYAWGETETKETYDWTTYRYCNGSDSTLTKYCFDESYGLDGYTDSLTTLEASDDAASVNWGGNWRMPTQDEMQELFDNCDTTWTIQNGINGMLFTSRSNGNSIFLPAAGSRGGSSLGYPGSYGYYWSSSLYAGDPSLAWGLYFNSDDCYMYYYYGNRFYVRSVRPVCVQSKKKRK